jgi:hypothetical protein
LEHLRFEHQEAVAQLTAEHQEAVAQLMAEDAALNDAHEYALDSLKSQSEDKVAQLMAMNGRQSEQFVQLQRESDVTVSLLRIVAAASKHHGLMMQVAFKHWRSEVQREVQLQDKLQSTKARVAVRCLCGFASLSGRQARQLRVHFTLWKSMSVNFAKMHKVVKRILHVGRHGQQKRAFRRWKTVSDRLVREEWEWESMAEHADEVSRVKTQHEAALARLMDANGNQSEQFVRLQQESRVMTSLLRTMAAASKQRAFVVNVAFNTWRANTDSARWREERLYNTMSYVFALASKETVVMLNMGFRRWRGFVDSARSEEMDLTDMKARVAVRCLLGFASLSGQHVRQMYAAFGRWKKANHDVTVMQKTIARMWYISRTGQQQRAFRWWKAVSEQAYLKAEAKAKAEAEMVQSSLEDQVAMGRQQAGLQRCMFAWYTTSKHALQRSFRVWTRAVHELEKEAMRDRQAGRLANLMDVNVVQSQQFAEFERESNMMASLVQIIAVLSKERRSMLRFAVARWKADTENARRHLANVRHSCARVCAAWLKASVFTLNVSMQRWKAAAAAAQDVERKIQETKARATVMYWLGVSALSGQQSRRLHAAFVRWGSYCARAQHEDRLRSVALLRAKETEVHKTELARLKTKQEEMLAGLMDANGNQSEQFAQLQRRSDVMVSLLRIMAAVSKQNSLAVHVAFKHWRSEADRARERDLHLKNTMMYVFALASKESLVMLNMGFKRWQGLVGSVRREETARAGTKARTAVRCLLGFASLSGQNVRRLHASFAQWKGVSDDVALMQKTMARMLHVGRFGLQKRAFRRWKSVGDQSHWEMVRGQLEDQIALGHRQISLARLTRSVVHLRVSTKKHVLNVAFRRWHADARGKTLQRKTIRRMMVQSRVGSLKYCLGLWRSHTMVTIQGVSTQKYQNTFVEMEVLLAAKTGECQELTDQHTSNTRKLEELRDHVASSELTLTRLKQRDTLFKMVVSQRQGADRVMCVAFFKWHWFAWKMAKKKKKGEAGGGSTPSRKEQLQSKEEQVVSLQDDLKGKELTVGELTEEMDLQKEALTQTLEESRKVCRSLQAEVDALKKVLDYP